MVKIIEDMISALETAKEDAIKLTEKGNKSAGTRIRMTMQGIKAKAQEIRVSISAMKTK